MSRKKSQVDESSIGENRGATFGTATTFLMRKLLEQNEKSLPESLLFQLTRAPFGSSFDSVWNFWQANRSQLQAAGLDAQVCRMETETLAQWVEQAADNRGAVCEAQGKSVLQHDPNILDANGFALFSDGKKVCTACSNPKLVGGKGVPDWAKYGHRASHYRAIAIYTFGAR